jgi:hypothetical protein
MVITCDLCGGRVPEEQVCKVGVFIPTLRNRPPTMIEQMRGEVPGEGGNFEACVECATAQLVALNARRLEIKRTGRVVEQ